MGTWKSPATQHRRDKVALRTIITNVKLKMIKIRTGCPIVLMLQRKPELGRTKTLTKPNVARRTRVGHSCLKVFLIVSHGQ